jgi:hypothetical protein
MVSIIPDVDPAYPSSFSDASFDPGSRVILQSTYKTHYSHRSLNSVVLREGTRLQQNSIDSFASLHDRLSYDQLLQGKKEAWRSTVEWLGRLAQDQRLPITLSPRVHQCSLTGLSNQKAGGCADYLWFMHLGIIQKESRESCQSRKHWASMVPNRSDRASMVPNRSDRPTHNSRREYRSTTRRNLTSKTYQEARCLTPLLLIQWLIPP